MMEEKLSKNYRRSRKAILSSEIYLDMQIRYADYVGIDEVGYGAWAGPLVICALRFKSVRSENISAINGKNIIDEKNLIDSKLLSSRKREKLAEYIKLAADFNLGVAEASEINEIGLAKSYENALKRTCSVFAPEKFGYGKFIIDGNSRKYFPCEAMVDGDKYVSCIAAASILAKVARDAMMDELSTKLPWYNFQKNKGYGTAFHQEALREHGFCNQHRRYDSLKKYLSK